MVQFPRYLTCLRHKYFSLNEKNKEKELLPQQTILINKIYVMIWGEMKPGKVMGQICARHITLFNLLDAPLRLPWYNSRVPFLTLREFRTIVLRPTSSFHPTDLQTIT
jgi:hypothetical protein